MFMCNTVLPKCVLVRFTFQTYHLLTYVLTYACDARHIHKCDMKKDSPAFAHIAITYIEGVPAKTASFIRETHSYVRHDSRTRVA